MAPKKPISANNINVTGDFIAGDQYNYYYTGDFASLAEYYISPESVFQRVRTDGFVGRDWLTVKVDAFLNDPNRKSGAFLLIGDAGVGKTSFMAHLVKERKYLHLFAEQVTGQAMLQRAMQSLASQLVSRYQIDPYKDRDTLNALSVFPDFLERILRLASNTLNEGEKIVIVCDALDEAGTFPDHFVFGLPKELPDGVYLILSQRPVNVKLPNYEPVIESLEAQGEGNLQDMEAYLSAVAKRPEATEQIRAKDYSEEFFIQTLKEKSQGVWMYLHYIIKEIESGARAPLDLANLPTGLVGYYAEYWDAWRTGKRGKGEDAWDELYAPLLTTLAAAQEAIPVDWLIQWAGVTAKPREVLRLLTEHWRAFIIEREVNEKKVYTPYHLSLKDFMNGRVDTNNLQPAQANLVKDLATQTVDAHKRIVKVFETECNGEWEKLVEQDYPRLYLAAHLNGAGEYEKLRMLLTEGDEKIKWAEAREKNEETYAGYLNDLSYVWDYAEREQNYALAIRCMFIENSIHSLAQNIPPELLVELAKASIWSNVRCLATIRENSNIYRQSEALRLLIPILPPILYQEVLMIANSIKDETELARILKCFIPYLSEDLRTQVLLIAGDFKDGFLSANLIVQLIPYFSEDLRLQSLTKARNINDLSDRALALTGIAPYLSLTTKAQVLNEVLALSREITNAPDRIRVLWHIANHQSEEIKLQFLEEALSVASSIKNEFDLAIALVDLAPFLSYELRQKGLVITRSIHLEFPRTRALIALAIHLPEKNKVQILEEVLSLLNKIEDEGQLARVLDELAPRLSKEQVSKLLFVIYNIRDENVRAHTMAHVAPYLSKKNKRKVLEDALSLISEIKVTAGRVDAIIALAPQLPGVLKAKLLNAAISIRYEAYRSFVLSRLFNNLSEKLKDKVIVAAHDITSGYDRASLLATLVPYLPDVIKRQVLEDALNAVREPIVEIKRAKVLLNLANYLPEKNKNQILLDVQVALHDINLTHLQLYGLVDLFLCLPDEIMSQVLEKISALPPDIKHELIHIDFYSNIAPNLSGELKLKVLEAGLDAASEIEDVDGRIGLLSKLIPHLPETLKLKVLESTLSSLYDIKDAVNRAKALVEFSPYYPKETRTHLIEDASNIAVTIEEKLNKISVLAILAPHLSREDRDNVLDNALTLSREIVHEVARAHALVILIPQLSKEKNNEVLEEVLSLVCSIKDDLYRGRILRDVSPYLTDEQRLWTLLTIREIEDAHYRSMILMSQVPYVTRDEKIRVFQQVLPFLQESSLITLFELWRKVEFNGLGDYILTFLRGKKQMDRDVGFEVATALIPALVHFRGPAIADELYRTITDVTRWWP